MNNIEQTIKRILREELLKEPHSLPIILRRRIPVEDLEDKFLEAFKFALILAKKLKRPSTSKKETIDTTINYLINHYYPQLFDETSPEGWDEKIRNSFEDYFKDRISYMYDEMGGINHFKSNKEFEELVTNYLNKKYKLNEQVDNSAKIKLKKIIEKQGLLNVIRTIGIEKVSKILQLEPIDIAREHFENKVYSIDDFGVKTGSYDFKFKITDIIRNDDDTWYVYAKIVNGTVDIDGDERELWDSDLWEEDYWWEIQQEIDDILVDILTPFLPKEIYVEIEHDLK